MAIKRVKKLIATAHSELELLIWYQRLVKLAEDEESLENCQLLVTAYRPLGDCQLEEIKSIFEEIIEELKINSSVG